MQVGYGGKNRSTNYKLMLFLIKEELNVYTKW